jgi:CheY-like chemotaxis protein
MLMTVSHSSNRILIADDDPVVRHLVALVVKQEGYTPVTLNDGRAVYRVLKVDADFKGAILDMSMPYLEGIELIRYMRTEKRLMRIPVMLITAQQSIKLLSDCFSAGAAAFLPKPFTPAQLQTGLRLLLGRKSLTRRAA